MDYTDSVASTYNAIAEEYSNDHANDTWDDDYLSVFAKMLPAGADILELGCGPGVEMKKLRAKGFHVHGLDISKRLLAVARRLNPDSPLTCGDMRKMPFENGAFDGVFAKASLLHIDKKDIPTALSEARRVLVPGGILHIAVKRKRPGQKDGYLTETDYGLPYTRFFSYWTTQELAASLDRAGFALAHSTETATSERTTWIKVVARSVR